MKVFHFSFLALVALVTTPAAAQDIWISAEGVLVARHQERVSEPSSAAQEAKDVPHAFVVKVQSVGEVFDWKFDATAAKVRLCAPDLDARLNYVDDLLGKLKADGAPRKEVRAWLTESAVGSDEFAWTSKLLLRDLDQMVLTLPDSLTELSGRMLFAEAIDDGLGLRALHLGLQEGPTEPKDAAALEVWIAAAGATDSAFPMASSSGDELMNLELRVTPSGARLRIIEPPHFAGTKPGANGGEEEQIWETELREYSGDTLFAIVSEHPELIGRLPFQIPGARAVAAVQVRTDILGVYTKIMLPDASVRFGLEQELGLEVVRIEPGTIAQLLGVSPGSVVLEVCGTAIQTGSGIADAMDGKAGAEICVVWLDSSGHRQERTWREGATSILIESIEIDLAGDGDEQAEPAPQSEDPQPEAAPTTED